MNPEQTSQRRAHFWLSKLAPGSAMTSEPVSDAPTRAAAERLLGSGAVGWGVETGREGTSFILESMPEFGGDPVAELLLSRAVEQTTLAILCSFLEGPGNPAVWPATEPANAIDSYVRRGIPVESVIRGIHLLQEVLARQLLAEIWAQSESPSEAQWSSDHMFRIFDAFTDGVATDYLSKSQEWNVSASAARDDLIGKLLDAKAEVDQKSMTSVLRYEIGGWHLGAVVWLGRAVDEAQVHSDVHAVIRRLLRAPQVATVVHRWADHTTVHLWCKLKAVDLPPDLGAVLAGTDCRIATGTAAAGRAGFRQSHREAVHAERIARMSSDAAMRVVAYDDLELSALLSNDLPAARRFVERRLRSLAETTPRASELRGTVAVYLQQDRSVGRTAEIVHAHRNTVVYRIKQAEEAIGPLKGRSLEIGSALRLVQDLGPAVLRQPG